LELLPLTPSTVMSTSHTQFDGAQIAI